MTVCISLSSGGGHLLMVLLNILLDRVYSFCSSLVFSNPGIWHSVL